MTNKGFKGWAVLNKSGEVVAASGVCVDSDIYMAVAILRFKSIGTQATIDRAWEIMQAKGYTVAPVTITREEPNDR
jgi:hypothetical protein